MFFTARAEELFLARLKNRRNMSPNVTMLRMLLLPLFLVLCLWATLRATQEPQSAVRGDFERFVEYNAVVADVSRKYPDIQQELVWALIWRESGYRADAVNGGDIGLGQLNYWRRVCQLSEEDAKDPARNIPCIFRALDYLFQKYPVKAYDAVSRRKLVLAAYNAGENAVNRCLPFRRHPECVSPGIPNNRNPRAKIDTPGYVRDIEQAFTFGERVVYYMRKVQQQKLAESSGSADDLVRSLRTETSQLALELRAEIDRRVAQERRQSDQINSYEQSLSNLRQALAAERARVASADRAPSADDAIRVAGLTSEVERLRDALDNVATTEARYQLAIDKLKQDAISERSEVISLRQELQARDGRIRDLESEVTRYRASLESNSRQIDELKRTAESSGGWHDNDRQELLKITRDNRQLSEQIASFSKKLTEKDQYIGGLVAQLKERVSLQTLSLQDLQKHAIAVISPPPIAPDTPLCTSGLSLGNVDNDLLSTGTLLAADFVNTSGLGGVSIPNVYSYTFRNATYTKVPFVPLAGTYLGSVASGDPVGIEIEASAKLTRLDTALSLKNHRAKLRVSPLAAGMVGCQFQSGVVAAFLPSGDRQAFLLMRATSRYDLFGYILIRARENEVISLLQFRASRVGR